MKDKTMLTFIRRANQSTQWHMDKVVAALVDDDNTYKLVKTDCGYAIDWTCADGGIERGSIVKCSNCKTVQDLWEGQKDVCCECGV